MTASSENYLKTILQLENKNSVVRSVDIAQTLEVSRPSVSRAMQVLAQLGYIYMAQNKSILLTAPGRETAWFLQEKFKTIARLLMHYGVDPQTAYRDACKIEHVVSHESYRKMKSKLNSILV